jgi:uncharacterized protein (TIGR01244 family)
MPPFRRVTDQLSVSPQISLADIEEAARQGFRLIVNNRPEGEDPAQTPGREIEAAAAAAGLAYVHIPIHGGPTREQVETEHRLLAESQGPTLAYCRSGTRSIVIWALGELMSGVRNRDELIGLGREAGYDLSNVLPS